MEPTLDRGALVGAVVVAETRCTSRCSGTWESILVRNFLNSIVRWRRWVELITVPSAVLNAANRLVVPCLR